MSKKFQFIFGVVVVVLALVIPFISLGIVKINNRRA